MRQWLWQLAAFLPVPKWLSLSYPARVFEKLLTRNYALQRRALQFVPADTRVLLDVGCGGAAYLEGCQVFRKIGLDASLKRLRIARKYCDSTIEHDLRNPDFMELEADCVLCLEVLEHLPKETGRRVLENLTGYPVAIISTPREFFKVRRNGYESHLSHWTTEELAQYGFQKAAEFQIPPSNIYVRQSNGR